MVVALVSKRDLKATVSSLALAGLLRLNSGSILPEFTQPMENTGHVNTCC
jgi:hypothetical protein